MPEPLFLLCPPRSFSSVVCGMLGVHPQTYGLPETHLFEGDTLGEACEVSLRIGEHSVHGILRAISQLHSGKQTEDTVAEAIDWVDEHRDWPIKKVFDHMQECVGDRILIEKSPINVIKPENLDRVYRNYPGANYLHLTRHPIPTGKSVRALLQRRIDEGKGRLDPGKSNPERLWSRCHNNARELLLDLAPGQWIRVKGEDLLRDLDIFLPQICEWLEIDDSPEAIAQMKHPETSPFAGYGPPSAKYGNDPNYLEEPTLDEERLKRIKEGNLDEPEDWAIGHEFTDLTRKLCREFGYR